MSTRRTQSPCRRQIGSAGKFLVLGGRAPIFAVRTGCVALGMMLALRVAPAQEALRRARAIEAAASQPSQSDSRPYTFRSRSGDFRLLVVPSLGLNWNDNINTADSSRQSDVIVRPLVQLTASYPVTDRNLLRLDVGVGYDFYLDHSERSGLRLQSGSALSFDVFIKDCWINLHDRFSYTQDPSQESAVANTDRYGDFRNTAGLLATWNLSDVVLSLGYDHETVISLSQRFEYRDHDTDAVVGRAGFRFHPKLTAGIEGSVAFTSYGQLGLNDNTAYSVGAYADWRPGDYLQIRPQFGYTIVQFDQTSPFIQTADLDAWYAGLNISHSISDAISYSLDAGHGIRLGISSDAIEETYVRPSLNWKILDRVNFRTGLFYEYGKQGTGTRAGGLSENYDWFGGNLGLTWEFLAAFKLNLNYRLTLRSSSSSAREYTQNLVGLQLAYQLP